MTNSAAPAGVTAGQASAAAGRAGATAGQAGATAGQTGATAAESGITAERAVAQLLSGPPAARAEEVAGRLLAIQGQDPRGARLAVRARSQGLSAADIDRALTVDRSLVISWLNRGTLHLVRSEDYWPLHRLTTPQLGTGCGRRLAQEGIPPAEADRAAGLIERFLTSDGPLTRAQLAERLQAAGVRTQGQALVFLLYLTSLRGISVRGPMIGKQHAHVLAQDWLGPPPAAPDPDAALGWLARRYLAGHSPATERDLAKWAGLPLRDARRALRNIAADLDEGQDDLVRLAGPADEAGRDGAARPGSRPGTRPEPVLPPPRLLGPFDPLLHGWQSRTAVLGLHEPDIVRGGMFRSFALADGRAVGTWAVSGDQVSLTLLERVSAAVRRALDTDAEDVRRFLGLVRPAA
jgi:Winged helix DNA-binding domain